MKTDRRVQPAAATAIPIRLVRGPVPVGNPDLIHIIATRAGEGPWMTVCAKGIPKETASTWPGEKADATCDLCRRWTTR